MAGHGGTGGSLPAKAIPFDHTTQELVLDFAGLSKLPTSADEAARSFRAVVVPDNNPGTTYKTKPDAHRPAYLGRKEVRRWNSPRKGGAEVKVAASRCNTSWYCS